jgi:maltose O-acetyltransferase
LSALNRHGKINLTNFIEKEEFPMPTETEKMLSGKIYDPSYSELSKLRINAHRLSKDYNDTYETDEDKRKIILDTLIPNKGKGLFLQGPIQFDYGIYTTFGDYCYANFNFTVLDCCPVKIGNDVFFGPNCTIATPIHPLLANERSIRFRPDGSAYDLEYAAPITIGNGCWIASNVVICGGVTIGSNCVIGAGSVVTRDIPDNMFAAGSPCRVIREITKDDSIELKKNLW